MSETWFSVEQVAHMIQLHPKTVQRYIREGKLKATKLGKAWRVAGHDLSLFTENPDGTSPAEPVCEVDGEKRSVIVSSVIDITASLQTEAMHLMNGLTALANGNRDGSGSSSVQVQYHPSTNLVRVSLWGTLDFTSVMMASIRTWLGGPS